MHPAKRQADAPPEFPAPSELAYARRFVCVCAKVAEAGPIFSFRNKKRRRVAHGPRSCAFFFVGACLRATGTLVSLFALVGLGEKTVTGRRRTPFVKETDKQKARGVLQGPGLDCLAVCALDLCLSASKKAIGFTLQKRIHNFPPTHLPIAQAGTTANRQAHALTSPSYCLLSFSGATLVVEPRRDGKLWFCLSCDDFC